jgi:hypothetical protein
MRAGLEVITLKVHLGKIRMLEIIKGLGRSTIDTLLIKYKSLNRMILLLAILFMSRDLCIRVTSLCLKDSFLSKRYLFLFVMSIVSLRNVLILMKNKDQSLAGGLAWKASKSSFGFKIGELK